MERKRSDEKKRRKPTGAAVRRTEVTESLYLALFEEWAEKGFAGISLERVATRAGSGKAAIYRRWSSRLEFAAEALGVLGLRVGLVEDRGSLEADVLALLFRFRALLRHPTVRRILPDLHATAARSPEMRDITRYLARERRQLAMPLLDRAIARGELGPNLDRALALDLIPAPLYWRMVVRGATPNGDELRRMAAVALAGLRALS